MLRQVRRKVADLVGRAAVEDEGLESVVDGKPAVVVLAQREGRRRIADARLLTGLVVRDETGTKIGDIPLGLLPGVAELGVGDPVLDCGR